jgi:hypothetical protein
VKWNKTVPTGNLAREETTYSTRLQFEIGQRPDLAVSTQLAKDLERVTEYRKSGRLTATEFFVQLKRIEYSLASVNGASQEAFIVFVQGELSLSGAPKDVVNHVSKLFTAKRDGVSPTVMSETSDVCAMAWRSALLDAERDSKTGRLRSVILMGCLLAYVALTKVGPVVSEAKYPFSQPNAAHMPLWDLASDSLIRVMFYLTTARDILPVVLGIAGAALNLFRRGVRNFEINIMFRDQVRGSVAVHLAVGAWSGFLAGFLLRYLIAGLSGDDLRQFLAIAGCFAAGYSSWFIDSAVDRVWQKLAISKGSKAEEPKANSAGTGA